MKKIQLLFQRLYLKKIDGRGLAIFRIAFAFVLLCDVLYLYYFKNLIFDKIPYLEMYEIEIWPVFIFWIPSLIMLVFGLYTRFAAIINYMCTVIIIGTITTFEYHMFYTYQIITFLFIFLPLSKNYSLDRLRLKLKISGQEGVYDPPNKVSVLAYYIPVLMGIGFVYFDSILFKWTSPLWLNGLGMWLPSSIPQVALFNLSYLLNLKYVVLALGYITLLFETIFVFVFYRKKWRIPILFIGLALHLGILITFPIPFFALGISAIYLLMVPVKFWKKKFIKSNNSSLYKVFYSQNNLYLHKLRIILDHLCYSNNLNFKRITREDKMIPPCNSLMFIDQAGKHSYDFEAFLNICKVTWFLKPLRWISKISIFRRKLRIFYYEIVRDHISDQAKPLIYSGITKQGNVLFNLVKYKLIFWGILILILLQLTASFTSPLPRMVRNELGMSNGNLMNKIESATKNITNKSRKMLGITRHGVFVEAHFEGYNHTIALIYHPSNEKEIWLPITNKDGSIGYYQFGPNWAKWGFRINSPHIDKTKLSNGIRDYTSFWAHKNGVDLKDAKFSVRVKKNAAPTAWEYDFLNKQLLNPWINAGSVEWKNKIFIPKIKDIEKL